jgi:hypothetical protein
MQIDFSGGEQHQQCKGNGCAKGCFHLGLIDCFSLERERIAGDAPENEEKTCRNGKDWTFVIPAS